MSWGHSECGKWSGRTYHGALLTELLSQWGWGCWRGEHPRTVTVPVSACPLLFRCSLPLPLTPLPLYLLFSGNCPPVGESQSPSGQSSAPASPPRLSPSASSPNFFKYLKHNPSGEQSGSAVPKSISYRNALRKKLHSSSSVPNFLKFLAPVDENNTSDFMNTQR